MQRAFLLAAVLVVAGCMEPEPEPADSDASLPDRLPDDWNRGVPLLPYQRGGYHSGAMQADLYPTSDLARPLMSSPSTRPAGRSRGGTARMVPTRSTGPSDWAENETGTLKPHA